ncbi:hypothetical protein [uncultured Brachyspira sp.]|uniref:hypothetical protein n=1 Tax=uncultured Brachyspira sp. TaxID=221953 RepID=UPI0026070774|nr:hypothetical protein [uncultured Brachyspira sp.]
MRKILFLLIVLLMIFSIGCSSKNNYTIDKYLNRVFYKVNNNDTTNYYYIAKDGDKILPIYFPPFRTFNKVFAHTFITNMPNNEYYYVADTQFNDLFYEAITFYKDKMYTYTCGTTFDEIEEHDNEEDTIINELLYSNTYILAEKDSKEEEYIASIYRNYILENKSFSNYKKILYSDDYDPDTGYPFKGSTYIKAFDILFGYNKNNIGTESKKNENTKIETKALLPDFRTMNDKEIQNIIFQIEQMQNKNTYEVTAYGYFVMAIDDVIRKYGANSQKVKNYIDSVKNYNSYTAWYNDLINLNSEYEDSPESDIY